MGCSPGTGGHGVCQGGAGPGTPETALSTGTRRVLTGVEAVPAPDFPSWHSPAGRPANNGAARAPRDLPPLTAAFRAQAGTGQGGWPWASTLLLCPEGPGSGLAHKLKPLQEGKEAGNSRRAPGPCRSQAAPSTHFRPLDNLEATKKVYGREGLQKGIREV